MRLATTSATAPAGAGSPARRARATGRGALAALVAGSLLLAACGGSARSSMRPIVDTDPDAASGKVDTPTTARPPSVTSKLDTVTTTAPPRQSRTDAPSGSGGGGSGGTGGGEGGGATGSDEVVADLSTPETTTTTTTVAVGGGGGTPSTSSTSTTLPPGTVAVKVRTSADLGVILVDGENHTLYASIADVNNEGTCAGECTAQWVPIVGNTVAPGDGVRSDLIGAITRADTLVQITYGGHPLYRLHNEPIGEVMGQADAATWYVVDAATGELVVP